MVIDTSAIFAAIAGEPDAAQYRQAIGVSSVRIISAVTVLETRIVLFSRLGPAAVGIFEELIERAQIAIIPFDATLADEAFAAFQRYGKGRGGRAQLNIVDCVAYALAYARNLPLLYKGGDFSRTDIQSALS